MVSDQDYNKISQEVYKVDSGKVNSPTTEGDKILNKNYQVLKAKDNLDNGMQAMAVAPIVDGEPDTSQIVIAYAGTNRLDSKDLSTDIQSLGLGSNKLGNGSDLSAENLVFSDSQFVTALDFADQI
ncbi:triacylglycerol lipase, partial [Streptococcus sp. H49]